MKKAITLFLAAILSFTAISQTGATSAGITGSGTTNYLPKFSAPKKLSNSILYQNGSKIGLGTTSPAAYFSVDHTNDGIDLIRCTSDGSTVFSARRSNIYTLANTHTFDGAGNAEFYFRGATNPYLNWQHYDLGTTLRIGGSIPKFETTRPAMEIEAPLLGIGTFGDYSDIAAKLHVRGDDGTTVSLYVEDGYIIFKALPTSTSGLISGTLWNNGGVLSIVP